MSMNPGSSAVRSGRRQIVQDAAFIVQAKSWRSPVIVQIELAPRNQHIAFEAGQYVQLCDPAYRLPPRSYSIANVQRVDGNLQLLVTAVPGGPVSGWLTGALNVGDEVLVSGPYGTFTLPPLLARPVLALAGGSGWAPLRALAGQAAQAEFPMPFHVLFSARTEDDVLDSVRIRQWQREHPNFHYQRTLTRADGQPPLGRIPQVLPTLYADVSAMDVYIAGSPALVAACVQAARSLGAQPGRVHTEEFYSDPDPW